MNTRLCWLGLGAVLVAAAILRLHAISAASLWFDEGISWQEASQPFATMIRLTAEDVHPPLHNSILYLFIRAFGDSETALRLPSAIMGVATVAAIFWVGSLVDGRTTGFLSAVLLCFSGFHIHYSQEARPYALLGLTATLFAGAAIRALETDRRGWHAASSLATLLLLYSHAYGMLLWFSFAIAGIAGARVWRDPAPRVLLRWAAGQAVAILLFLPWAGILAWHYKLMVTHGFWIPEPSPRSMLALVDALASGQFTALVLFLGVALALAPPSFGLRLGLAPETGIRGAAEDDAARRHAHLIRALLLAWLLGPLLLALIASLISQPILTGRYVICSLPAGLILASMGLRRLLPMPGKWVLALGPLAALAGTVVIATANLWSYQPFWNEDARGTVQAYVAQAESSDCVFASSTDVDFEVRYYLRNPPACYLSTAVAAKVAPWAFGAPRGWLFLRDDNPNFKRRLAENLQAHGWRARPVIADPKLSLFALEPAK